MPNDRNPTLLQLVEQGLRAGGFDGLYHASTECACKLGDLAPCGEPGSECRAGYLRAYAGDCGADWCGDGGGSAHWHIEAEPTRETKP